MINGKYFRDKPTYDQLTTIFRQIVCDSMSKVYDIKKTLLKTVPVHFYLPASNSAEKFVFQILIMIEMIILLIYNRI